MTKLTKALTAPAILAAASLTAVPAMAADLPTTRHAPTAATSHYGPYYGGRWGGGYRHRRGTSAGDVLAGVLILGTIAAVASAASKNAQQRRGYPERYPYPERRGDYRPDGPQGLEGAADLCMREVERNARAREVTRVERSAGGWLVTGAMADGSGFSCSIGADGRIDRVDVGGQVQGYEGADRQYDDERYRSARADVDANIDTATDDSGADAQLDTGPQPAYPGGPLPGEEDEGDSPES